MNRTILFLIGLVLWGLAVVAVAVPITDYHSTFIAGYDEKDELQIAIRMYYLDETPYFLVVDPHTFVTKNLPAVNFKTRQSKPAKPGYFSMQNLQETPYLKALKKYSSPPYRLQNYGITHAVQSVKGTFLTVDMCPSSKPFEKDFFNELVSLADRTHQPIPVALAVSGLWMIGHPQEFDWLIAQQNEKKLAITWVNHSFSHVYYPDLALEKNFMLDRPDDFEKEILETEKILLMKQQLPSVFFRFPGLVEDKSLIIKLRELGLIAVGSDAWLAKGEKPHVGSIILVHGNSNEPAGIQKMMPLLQKLDLHLLPLKDAILVNEQ